MAADIIDKCIGCKQEKHIYATSLCKACYNKLHPAKNVKKVSDVIGLILSRLKFFVYSLNVKHTYILTIQYIPETKEYKHCELLNSVESIQAMLRRTMSRSVKEGKGYKDVRGFLKSSVEMYLEQYAIVINKEDYLVAFKNLWFDFKTKRGYKPDETGRNTWALAYFPFDYDEELVCLTNENHRGFTKLTEELFYGKKVYAKAFLRMLLTPLLTDGVAFWIYSDKNSGKSSFFDPLIKMAQELKIGSIADFIDITSDAKTQTYFNKFLIFDDDASTNRRMKSNEIPMLKKQFNNREIIIDVKFKDAVTIQSTWTGLCLANDVLKIGDVNVSDGSFDRVIHLKVKHDFITNFKQVTKLNAPQLISGLYQDVESEEQMFGLNNEFQFVDTYKYRELFSLFNRNENRDQYRQFIMHNNSVVKFLHLVFIDGFSQIWDLDQVSLKDLKYLYNIYLTKSAQLLSIKYDYNVFCHIARQFFEKYVGKEPKNAKNTIVG